MEEAQQEVEEKMTKKLQMPPVMDERDAASKVLNIWRWKHKEQVCPISRCLRRMQCFRATTLANMFLQTSPSASQVTITCW